MAKFTYVDEVVESKSEKRVRIFLAVMFFIQTVITTFPFMQGNIEAGFTYITAFNMLVQNNGYTDNGDFMLVIVGAVLVIFPLVAFFFFVLDKKSKKKYVVSAICSIACAVVITFGIGGAIAIGGVLTLIINVVCLFMTMQGLQATRMREKTQTLPTGENK